MNIANPIPALYVTSWTFEDLIIIDLICYITEARTRMTNNELKEYPHAKNGIFRIQTNIKGCPTHSFRNNNIGAWTIRIVSIT